MNIFRKFGVCIISFLWLMNLYGQDSSKIFLGTDLLGWSRNSIDATCQYKILNQLAMVVFVGHRFNTQIMMNNTLHNTRGIFSKGNFLGGGVKFYGFLITKHLRPFISANICWSSYEQTAEIFIPTYYGVYNEPYIDKKTTFGYQLYYGICYNFSTHFQFEMGLKHGSVKINPDNPFNHSELFYPGFGRAWWLSSNNRATTVSYVFILYYHF